MTEQEKKELLAEVRTYVTDPKNSQKWKMAPYFSSVVLNFLNNYADKFDDPERVMNVVKRLKVEPFRKNDRIYYASAFGLMVGNNSVDSIVEKDLRNLKYPNVEMRKKISYDESYKNQFIKEINHIYEHEQRFNERFPISLRLNQYNIDESFDYTDAKGKDLKAEKIAELFSSLGENDNFNVDKVKDSQTFYERYETLTHELAHGFAHYKSESKAKEEINLKNQRDKYQGGVNSDKLNYIHEGMTEWLARKAVDNLNKDMFSKISVTYEPFVAYAEIIHTLFPEGFYDIYFNGPEKLKKYENIYPDLSLEDMIEKYGKLIQNLKSNEKRIDILDLEPSIASDEVRYHFSNLKKKVLKYAQEGVISKEKSRHILEQMNLCYNDRIYPIDFLTESCDREFITLEKLVLNYERIYFHYRLSKIEDGDYRLLTYLDVKKDGNKLDKIHTFREDKVKKMTEEKVKKIKIDKEVLDKESEILDTKIWVLKDGTVGFGDDAIKAFRQHRYDIEDAVMIDCKYDRMPQIIKQNNQSSLSKYSNAKLYEETFIKPDYETKQKLSKEQSCAVLSMAVSVGPDNKNLGIMIFDNLEFDKEALKSLEQNFPKIKVHKVSGKRLAEEQKERDKKIEMAR